MPTQIRSGGGLRDGPQSASQLSVKPESRFQSSIGGCFWRLIGSRDPAAWEHCTTEQWLTTRRWVIVPRSTC